MKVIYILRIHMKQSTNYHYEGKNKVAKSFNDFDKEFNFF